LIRVNIIGAGGHCRSLISLAQNLGIEIAAIYDNSFDADANEMICGIPVNGALEDLVNVRGKALISSGVPKIREELYTSMAYVTYQENVIDTSALVRSTVEMGNGNHIFPMVFLNAEVKMGDNNLINSKALIEHESVIGDHNHIAVGAIICGRVIIGSLCFIGAGSIIKDSVSICDEVIIGAGAVVLTDIVESGTYVGNPARRIK
jgi:UDP-N-acetylbacillosamine N-acetyltransferase